MHVTALSRSSPSMMSNADLAVLVTSYRMAACRALVDTGAMHCQSIVQKSGHRWRGEQTCLTLANGSKADSKGKAVISLDMQFYQPAGANESFLYLCLNISS